MTSIVIEPRFRGPPESGNGGYTCGRVAAAAGSEVAVRLKRPPPLGVPLELAEADGILQLRHGDDVIAEARPTRVDVEVPSPLDHAEAVVASLGFAGFAEHPFPGCFVCGPQRMAGDGLRIFAGPVVGRPLVAAPWVPDGSLAGPDGRLHTEFLWSALDCPSGFATPIIGRVAVLGEFAARIERPLSVGEPCVVMGWHCGGEGRKHHSASAIIGPDGDVVARATATWIALKT